MANTETVLNAIVFCSILLNGFADAEAKESNSDCSSALIIKQRSNRFVPIDVEITISPIDFKIPSLPETEPIVKGDNLEFHVRSNARPIRMHCNIPKGTRLRSQPCSFVETLSSKDWSCPVVIRDTISAPCNFEKTTLKMKDFFHGEPRYSKDHYEFIVDGTKYPSGLGFILRNP